MLKLNTIISEFCYDLFQESSLHSSLIQASKNVFRAATFVHLTYTTLIEFRDELDFLWYNVIRLTFLRISTSTSQNMLKTRPTSTINLHLRLTSYMSMRIYSLGHNIQ